MYNFKNVKYPIHLAQQLLFDCAIELLYHQDGLSDEQIADKILDINHALDELNLEPRKE